MRMLPTWAVFPVIRAGKLGPTLPRCPEEQLVIEISMQLRT